MKRSAPGRLCLVTAALFLLAGTAACVAPAGSIADFKKHDLPGAAVALRCPVARLRVVELDSTGTRGHRLKVIGCSRRALYKYAVNVGWVRTRVSREAVRSADTMPRSKTAPPAK